jgi:hypothetical protein
LASAATAENDEDKLEFDDFVDELLDEEELRFVGTEFMVDWD